MVDWREYEHVLNTGGAHDRHNYTEELKAEYLEQVVDNPGYEPLAKRNGVVQPMLFLRGEVRYKINVVLNPGDELYPGDLVEAYGETWLCTETRAMDTIQTTGLLWLCNHQFRWQNFDSEIHYCWGILDSGVYSTTKNGNEALQYLDKQYKIYLPYNDDTAKIYIDKRIATEKMYNQFGEQILATYDITGVDHTSRSYGKGAHLLILNARSGAYNASTDNIDLMLCDYISPEQKSHKRRTRFLECKIEGKNTVQPGKTRVYSPVFDNDDIVPVWGVGELPDGVTYKIEDGKLYIAADKTAYVGTSVIITLEDETEEYVQATMEVEVTAYG